MKPFIIADIGSNHRGSPELALKQITAAKECGADAAKFQLYSAVELYGFHVDGVDQHSIRPEWLPELKAHANACKIELMVTAFSPEGVAVVDPFVSRHKLASSEMMHWEMWDALLKTGKEIIFSTGGQGRGDVRKVYQYVWDTRIVGVETRIKALECVALYPAAPELYNLKTLTFGGTAQRLSGTEFGHGHDVWHYSGPSGISDHTLTDSVALASIGFGATIFEKHFDGVGLGETPDSPVSADMVEMSNYVFAIREAFSAIGDGIKQPRHQNEMALRWRRRLICTKDLPALSKLKAHDNYGIYRSLKDDTRGAPPEMLPKFDGATLKVDKRAGDSLWVDDVE